MKNKGKHKFPYTNRELSWLDFNFRVLDQAFKNENPVAERLKFLGISASNLDEFFMVRVAGVMDKALEKSKKQDYSGLTPKQQLLKTTLKIKEFLKRQYFCLEENIKKTLKNIGIAFVDNFKKLTVSQKEEVDSYFENTLFPILTPLAVDKSRPFPQILNKTLNIIARLEKNEKSNFAVVQVPNALPRFLELKNKKDNNVAFILLEDIIIQKIEKLFEPYKVKAAFPFRITRNSDLNIDEAKENLIVAVQKSIKKRKRGTPVRLEIFKNNDLKTKKFLMNILNVPNSDVYEIPGPIDLTFLSKFSELEILDDYRFSETKPKNPPKDFKDCKDIFAHIKKGDRLVHHPYESFDIVLDFIRKASTDENVISIKQTLYRVSGKSLIIDSLIKAAENGKQVTVLVELKARFDEENNIIWAKKLEQAGCHVIYGLPGLKTHCKLLLIVRKEKDKMVRYVHMSTGNYNDFTAKNYTDIGFFTCKESFGEDVSALFNLLTGYSKPKKYNKLIVAPDNMKSFLKKKILNEIENKKKNLKSGIVIKINALVDIDIIKLLYKASSAGVKIDLIVRGICCLVPGIKEFSENITVHSIVGRFLEHSRIYKFENGGEPLFFLGSADLMPRNLERRIEVIFPVEDEHLKKRLSNILETVLEDTVNRKIQLSNTFYVTPNYNSERLDSQKELFES